MSRNERCWLHCILLEKKKEPVLKSRDLGLCHSYLWWPKGLLASAPALARFNTQCRADSVVWLLVQLFLEVCSPWTYPHSRKSSGTRQAVKFKCVCESFTHHWFTGDSSPYNSFCSWKPFFSKSAFPYFVLSRKGCLPSLQSTTASNWRSFSVIPNGTFNRPLPYRLSQWFRLSNHITPREIRKHYSDLINVNLHQRKITE